MDASRLPALGRQAGGRDGRCEFGRQGGVRMAKPLTHVIPIVADETADTGRFERPQLTAEDREALGELLRLVRALHARGVLSLASALLEKGDEVLDILVHLANQPRAVRGLKNLMVAAETLSVVDLSRLSQVVEGAAVGLQRAETQRETLAEPVGLFGLLSTLADPDVSAGIRLLISALQGVGRAVRGEAGGDAPGECRPSGE
ncbi:MAG: DUF1641 domain-containing protein [Alicyclobacillus herbarius]|uniref:DUF1641 domain-containing protein n=1 Tax=Alicyclobacillus herbarius TaxID=122960 RepID=UPI002353DD0B|nr:DUF1641 domain-containing protein [Alicyclobacillus herbarius]MCL6632519.1 DUF1641 domain-containing protein [Alicyclobacillus herbarius]